MFTGLVQKIGSVRSIRPRSEGAIIEVAHDEWNDPIMRGESICVSGTCLTVTDPGKGAVAFDVLMETLQRTSLGRLKPGSQVNLERALRPTDRMGGHYVSGHVDGTGIIASITKAGADRALRIRCGDEIMPFIVHKGSIACDGVSLTVAGLGTDWFEVHVIPETCENTTLGNTAVDSVLNLEGDLIGKYVLKHLQHSSQLTVDHLRQAGFPV